MAYDYDLFTIGAGSGGVRASRLASTFGARVAVAEKSRLGGTCVNVGCVPKKLLAYAGRFREEFIESRAYGWSTELPEFDWATLIRNKDEEIARLNRVYGNLLESAGVDVLRGHARIIDPHTIDVDGQSYTAEHILLATGGRPVWPEIPGAEHAISSNDAFELAARPERMIIVGGGYIACEFASIFHGVGSRVCLMHRGHAVLRGFDEDVRQTLTEELAKKGIELAFKTEVLGIDKLADGSLRVTLSDHTHREVDAVMFAIGRRANVEGLGLENIGLSLDERGLIPVETHCRTSVDNVFAVGDLSNEYGLTPVALHEGTVVANCLFNDKAMETDHGHIPTAVFGQPEVGTVGLTEDEACRQLGAVDIYISRFSPLKHTLSGTPEKTMMKLIVDRKSDRVVGFHVVGADAAEMTQGVAVAMKAGATKRQFDSTIGIHPTSAEEFVTMRTKRPDPHEP